MKSIAFFSLVLALAGCAGKTDAGAMGASPTPPPVTPEPTVAATTFPTRGAIVALSTNLSHVCWSSFGGGRDPQGVVACAAKTDGRVVELSRGPLRHPWLAVSGEQVFWSTEMTATLERAPVTGGAAEVVVARAGPHGRFVIEKDSAYWLVARGAERGQLFAAWVGGQEANRNDTTSPLVFDGFDIGAADPDLLAVRETSVYARPTAYTFSDGVLGSYLDGRGPTEKLSAGCYYPTDLVFDASGRVVVSCQDGTLRWVATRSDVPRREQVLSDLGFGRIAARGDGVVYVTDAPSGKLRRVNLLASTVELVAEGLDAPMAIAVDTSGVYVADGARVRRFPL